jgi:hypothetical protein
MERPRIESRKNGEIVNRQADRLVEVFADFAVLALGFTAIRLECLEKINFAWRQGAAQQLRYR